MLARALFATASLAAFVAAQQPASPPARHLVLVRPSGPAQLQQLLALDLDLAACRTPLPAERRVEAIVDDAELARLRTLGFRVDVLQRDLSAHYAAQAARFPASGVDVPNPPLGQGAMGGHWTFAQMEAILDDLHNANPAICSARVSIGSTIENRPLWMVKISDHVGQDENEPEVLFDAMHHAREPLSMEATVVFMDWLVTNYGTDPLATFLVDERELYFVPCLNPDGYEYNRQTNPGGGGLWRKNRRNNGDGTFGIDLNRNYATGWSAPNGGSSTVTSSDTYRGTAPFSEPETQAIDAFVASRQFVTVFSTHTYQDVLLRPWGWQLGDPANVADYQTLGAYYVQENGLQHGSTSALLYIASGSAVDHHHTVRGIHSWTAELGRSDEGGFWPSGQAIVDIAMRHQPMFRKIASTAGATFAIENVVVDEVPGTGNGNGAVEPGEGGRIAVTVRNVGLAAAPVDFALQLVTPGLGLGTATASAGTVPALSPAGSAPYLTFTVPGSITTPTVQLRVLVTGDGRTQQQLVTVDLLPRRLVVADDFEQDRGCRRAPGGTATTGLWERSTPVATVNGSTPIQPGTQTTPGGSRCWVTDGRGGSAGTYDVDGGYTDFETPELDLSHLLSAEVRLQYWYAESVGDDAMTISVSRDGGGSWSPLFSRSTSTGAWAPLALDLGSPLTTRMKLRVRAQDLAASLVECLVDDLAIHGQVLDGNLTLFGSGGPGTRVQVAMHGAPGTVCFPLAALGPAPGLSYPGVGGLLLVDPATALVMPFAVANAAGRAATEVALPAGTGFAGLVFHWQAALFGPSGAAFGGNATRLTLQ